MAVVRRKHRNSIFLAYRGLEFDVVNANVASDRDCLDLVDRHSVLVVTQVLAVHGDLKSGVISK